MKKMKIFTAIAVIIVLAIPFSVFATTSDAPAAKAVRGFFGIDVSKLTDKQKGDVKDYTQKMGDLQKDFINKMVANGSMTKEQGDAAIKDVEEKLANSETKGYIPGFENGKRGFGGKGGPGGMGFAKIDISKLTDKQKTDLLNTIKNMAVLQKDMINKMVADKLLTKEQGDNSIKSIDEQSKSLEENGLTNAALGGKGLGCFDLFRKNGIDPSKLTDQQKTDLKDYSKKMADLQKELINKLISSGSLTKEQGDAAISRIDKMLEMNNENGFPFGMRMKKGHFGGQGRETTPEANSTAVPSM